MILVQANMHANKSRNSWKSSRQYSHKPKHKKRQKCSARHVNQAYPETTELNMPMTLTCDVGCQKCKIDARNEICIVQFLNFDKINIMTRMPQI